MPYCASWLMPSKGFAQEPYRISPEMLFTIQYLDRPHYVCCSSAVVPIQPHPPRFTIPLLDLPQRGIPRQAPPSSTKGSATWFSGLMWASKWTHQSLFFCVVHSDAEPLVSLLTSWESLVGEAIGYYDSSAVAMVTAKVLIALDLLRISTVLELIPYQFGDP